MQVPAGPLERLPGAGQQQFHLWVHVLCFSQRHSKKPAIKKQFLSLAEQPLIGAGEPTWARKPADRSVPPAVPVHYGFLYDLPLAEQAPEVVIGSDSTRQAVTISYDGYVVTQHKPLLIGNLWGFQFCQHLYFGMDVQ